MSGPRAASTVSVDVRIRAPEAASYAACVGPGALAHARARLTEELRQGRRLALLAVELQQCLHGR